MKIKAILSKGFKIFFLLVLISAGIAHAQVKITFPVERAIFQRNNANQAVLSIGGYYTQMVDKIEARLIPIQQGQGQYLDWTVIQSNPQGGTYLGTLNARGGWYTLEVRASYRGVEVGKDVLGRVGVGEIFVVAGQSNAEGIYNSNAPESKDDRVNCLTFNNRNSDKTDTPELTFGRIGAESLIGPRGRSAWCWGVLGDLLAAKLNVPILFMNVGWENSNAQNWLESAKGNPTKITYIGDFFPASMPYGNLNMVLRYYGSILGIRAILWLQGETDTAIGVTREDYQARVQELVDIARATQGDAFSTVPWVISRTSRVAGAPYTSASIIDAQNAIIARPFNKAYPGPYTDDIQVPRPGGVHFSGSGLSDLARAWDNLLPPSFFATVVPVTSRQILPLRVSCNTPNVSINIKAPDGFNSYRWSNGQTAQTITASGVGTYSVSMKDNIGNIYLSPALIITEPQVQPPNPVISPSGEQVICADSSINLSVNANPINQVYWSNGFEGRTININKPITLTARITNVFGCSTTESAPTTIKTLAVKAPTITQNGVFSLEATPDPAIYIFADSKVSKIVWDWRQGTLPLSYTDAIVKLTDAGTYSARSRVTFSDDKGGNLRTCFSPYSTALSFQPSTTETGLIVYPNPNKTGKVNIEILKDLSNVEIEITSLNGQIVYQKKLSSLKAKQLLDLTHLADGMYIFNLVSTGFKHTQKLIIEK